MDISIVLLTWNSGIYIEKCLESVFSDLAGGHLSYEIFVVDNGSKDNTRHILNLFKVKYPDHFNIINLRGNAGTTYPRNLALKKAKGEYIVIMDSDVEISIGTIGKLIRFLENNEHVGIVAPMLKYPSGRIQISTDAFPTLFTKIYRYFFLKKDERNATNNTQSMSDLDVDYAISAMWMLKRIILEKVGLLDENIFYSPEDVDYCVRVRKLGYKIACYPAVTGIHHTQEISRGLKRSTFLHIRGLVYYFNKHHCWFSKPEV